MDARGRAVLPGYVDSHAHLVFAGERGAEFAARMAGAPYQAGGILATVAATRRAADPELRANLRRLVGELLRQGTTTFECKSGYGLTVPDEARSAPARGRGHPRGHLPGRARRPARVRRRPGRYVDLVCGPMLDACAPNARWIDVFCDRGAFGADEAAPSCGPATPLGCCCGCTPTSSARGLACSSPCGPGPRPPIIART